MYVVRTWKIKHRKDNTEKSPFHPGGGGGGGGDLSSKTLFYNDCSLGSVETCLTTRTC